MILAPLVGIILNLLHATEDMECREHNDVVGIFASMDCPDMVHCGFQYLLDYNWVSSFILLSFYTCMCGERQNEGKREVHIKELILYIYDDSVLV